MNDHQISLVNLQPKLFDFELSHLPYVAFTDIDQLPDYSGIYFVTDSENRMLYIGKANNIRKRWKAHHRKYQLEQINSEKPVIIAWLAWNLEDLSSAETYFINRYHPLFNQTKIITPEVIPSEIMLIELLEAIKKVIVIIGIKPAYQNHLCTVYIKYNYRNSGKNGCAQTIKRFKKENKERISNLNIKRLSYGLYRESNVRPGSREHKRISRLQSSYNNHWIIGCNGVIIDITPTDEQEFKYLRSQGNSTLKKLAGVKIRTVKQDPLDSSLSIMIHDPIRLLWSK